jgi:hypothetical protein
MKNSMDMVRTSLKELADQVAGDRKWKRTIDDRMDKMLVMQEGWQMREREKTTESLQMAMNREARKRKTPPGKGNDDDEEDENSDTEGGPMGELCYGNNVTTVEVTRLF